MEMVIMLVVLGAIAALALGAVARDVANARRRARATPDRRDPRPMDPPSA